MLLVLIAIIISATHALLVQEKLHCEDIPVDLCAFAVSSTGARCVLERRVMRSGDFEYECQTSVVRADEFAEWVETDDCVRSCGQERMCVGMSSDALVERDVATTLCSAACQASCPNIVDLYTKLAAGEGVSLPRVCELVMQRTNNRRFTLELASGSTPSGPAPAPASA